MTEFNVNSKLPDLVVEGDVMLKEFNFLVDNKIDKPVKIGRVGTSFTCPPMTNVFAIFIE